MSGSGFPRLFETCVAQSPDGVLFETVDGRQVSYSAFYGRVLLWADALSSLRMGEPRTVSTMLENSVESFEVWLGLAWARCVEVPVNPEYRGQMLVNALNDCRATVLLIQQPLLDRLIAVLGELRWLRNVVVLPAPDKQRTDQQHLPGVTCLSAEELLQAASPRPRPAPGADDVAVVIYTSGTTGRSKGVIRTWFDVARAAGHFLPGEEPGIYPGGAYHQVWPMFHLSGRFGLVTPVTLGLRIVVRPRLSISHFWSEVRAFGITHACLMWVAPLLMQAPVADSDADNPLAVVLMSPLTKDYREFERRFGVRVVTAWGMTEAGMPLGAAHPQKPGTCGRPHDGVRLRLVDGDGRNVPDGHVGELLVAMERPTAPHGYLEMPDATSRTWQDGWVHTGDAFIRDRDGDFFFVDRLKDSVRRRGNNISSLEVEQEINAHPDVVESACIGVPWELAQSVTPGTAAALTTMQDEEIKVFVVRRPGSNLSAEDLIVYVAAKMPRYMIPRFVMFVGELPKTATGKIMKQELRGRQDEAWDLTRSNIDLER